MKRPHAASPAASKRPRGSAPPRRAAPPLPVVQQRERLLAAVAAHDVVILVSETGSGKTTQLPQLLLAADPRASIVVTQPRRVAAVAVAARVADERGVELGGSVGYAVRFDDRSSAHTRIRYVTDGVLLRESMSRDALARYTHVVVDEVHERSVNTDVILGVVKRALLDAKKASDGMAGADGAAAPAAAAAGSMKVVIMSATTDADKLKRFFEARGRLSVTTMRIPGRLHRVDTFYTAAPVQDFVDGAVTAALQVHVDYPMDGDVLVFLPGQDEIMSAMSLLAERVRRHLSADKQKSVAARPLFASLPPLDQARAMTALPPELGSKRRKIIFATNVAETSITIPGVKYVVDSGMAKVRTLLSARGLNADVLRLESISKAQAEQRKGRAGRMGPGIVFRLYTESQYEAMMDYPVPEVLRVDAASTVLQIMAYDAAAHGPGLLKFPRLDAPPKRMLVRALETLMALGALDDNMELTQTGKLMSRIPTSPLVARSLLEAARLGCVEDMVALAAILSVEGGIFFAPVAQRDAARAAHRRFISRSGDHLTLVNVYRAYIDEDGNARRTAFCKDHFLNYRTLASAESIADQLNRLMQLPVVLEWALTNPTTAAMETEDATAVDLLRRCVVAGFFRNAARRREEDGKYVLVGSVNRSGGSGSLAETGVNIHPSSVLCTGSAKRGPPLVIFNELVLTSKPYIRTVMAIEQSLLVAHSGSFFKSDT
jgi:HrpA-like RNA helicase